MEKYKIRFCFPIEQNLISLYLTAYYNRLRVKVTVSIRHFSFVLFYFNVFPLMENWVCKDSVLWSSIRVKVSGLYILEEVIT